MSQGNVCRLCVDICEDYKSIYDESGNANEVHQLMVQYFDQMQLFTGHNFTLICMKCWHQISDFNKFQQSVYQTQRILLIKEEEIDIKSEEEFLPEDNTPISSKAQSNDCNIFLISDPEIMYVSSFPDSSNVNGNMEYDGPVDGEFSNSRALPAVEALNAECREEVNINDKATALISKRLRRRKKYGLSVKASDDLIAQWAPVLKCIHCTETCSTYSLLQYHFQDKHPLVKCQARCCGKKYSSRDRYEDHIRLHIDSNSYACTLCGRQQKCRRTLALHIREHRPVFTEATVTPTDDSNFVSPTSESSTESAPNKVPKKLSTAKYIKGSDDFIAEMIPTLKCYLCPEIYSTFSMFRIHFSLTHPENQCYITCCQRKLTARFRILEHLQLHVNPDVFKCNLCEVRYTTRHQLQSHLRKRHNSSNKENTKTNKKKNTPFEKSDRLLAKWLPCTECAVCKKSFATLTLLQSHFRNCHPNEGFHVECCQRKLQTRRKIEEHARYHLTSNGFKCELCCIHYSHERSLKKHMRIVH